MDLRPRALGPWLACAVAAASAGCGLAAGPSRTAPTSGPSLAVPQSRPPAPPITTFADSFLDVRQRPPRADTGWLAHHFEATASGYRLTQAFGVGPHALRGTVAFLDRDLGVDSVQGWVWRADGGARFSVAYSGRRVTGWYESSAEGGSQRLWIDAVRPESALDGNSFLVVLPTLPWAVGLRRTLFVFDPTTGETQTRILTVLDEEQVTVPAGTFDAFRAELVEPANQQYVWYTRAVPHRCVKAVDVTNDVTSELIR